MQQIGGIFYINLAKRTDRRCQIEDELARMGLTAERFEGILKSPGIVGCGYSHLAVLKEARDRGLKNVLIFEDDFELLVDKETFFGELERFFQRGIPYDVVMLSYNIEKSVAIDDLIMKVDAATTASGYIVNSAFYDTLIELYETNLPLLESTGHHWLYANDQIWKQLQPSAQWFAFTKRLGRQRGSYSDNSCQFMDYGV
jgi:GR25 family glycosyltransferase involved in LPS biosynthesis